MSGVLACPHCGQSSQWPPEQGGQVVQCPHCYGQMTLPIYSAPSGPTASAGDSGWMVISPFNPEGSARSIERGLAHMQRSGVDSKGLLTGMVIMWLVIGGLFAAFVIVFFVVLIAFLAFMNMK